MRNEASAARSGPCLQMRKAVADEPYRHWVLQNQEDSEWQRKHEAWKAQEEMWKAEQASTPVRHCFSGFLQAGVVCRAVTCQE